MSDPLIALTGRHSATTRAARAGRCVLDPPAPPVAERTRAGRGGHGRSPRPGTRVLELGCGLGAPSIAAARAGAEVLATDGATDGDVLAARGPWDLVLAADLFYTRANVEAALGLLPRLLAAGGEVRLADPGRAGARDFLAAARGTFSLRTEHRGEVALHALTPREPGRG